MKFMSLFFSILFLLAVIIVYPIVVIPVAIIALLSYMWYATSPKRVYEEKARRIKDQEIAATKLDVHPPSSLQASVIAIKDPSKHSMLIPSKNSRDEYIKNKRLKYQNLIDSMVSIPIVRNDSPSKKSLLSDMPELKLSSIRKNTPIDKLKNYIVIDVETTGLHARNCDIIEISAVKFENFQPTEHMTTFINPQKPIPLSASKINGIKDDDVINAPCFYEVISSFESFMSGYPIVAHNLPFDIKFLFVNNLDLFKEKRSFYDTLDISRKILTKIDYYKYDRAIDLDKEYDFDVYDYKLPTLCEYYEIYPSVSHRAVADCVSAGLLFKNLIDEKIN